MDANRVSFEEAIERLEQVVRELEEGRVSLDRAMELFAEGMRLSGLCRNILDKTEKQITILAGDEGM